MDWNGDNRRTTTNNNPLYAYGNFIPTIKSELKQDQLPSWDGNHDTAIEYFWKVQQLAALGGYIPQALGYWLWHNLKEGSTVQLWFAMLAPHQQEYMRTHYLNFLRGIKEGFLGRIWQMKMNKIYENQSFRQPGHEYETPTRFIVRRIMYTRMLVNSDNGGPLEIFLVMQRAPISWGPVINIDSIQNTSDLYAKVTEHEKALIHASKLEQSHLITADNLAYTLRRMGVAVDDASSRSPRPLEQKAPRLRNFRRANLGEKSDDQDDENGIDDDNVIPEENVTIREAFQVVKGRPRPPPKGGYPFQKNDHVTTKMGRPPPSPCKVCGSANHWDKECPDWNVYLETRKRSANLGMTTGEDTETESYYKYAYTALLNEKVAMRMGDGDKDKLPEDFFEAVKDLINDIKVSQSPLRKAGVTALSARKKVTIEEVDDVDAMLGCRGDPPSNGHIIEEVDREKGPEPPPVKQSSSGEFHAANAEERRSGRTLPSGTRMRIPKARQLKPGQSSIGVSVLSVKGRVNHMVNPEVDLRLDSGADITLISEEYLGRLPSRPKILKGQKLKLWQLTDGDCEMKGYVRVPILVDVDQDKTVEMEAEAYVVPGMTVPILLGEDFQQTYELSVQRSAEKGTTMFFGRSPFSVQAAAVERTDDFLRVKRSGNKASAALKDEDHGQRKRRKQRLRRKGKMDELVLRATEDTIIHPDKCKLVSVSMRGAEMGNDDYFFESGMIVDKDENSLVIPNILFNSAFAFIPVSNISTRPRLIKKGELLGHLRRANEVFDRPGSTEKLREFEARAYAYQTFIQKESAEKTQPTNVAPEANAKDSEDTEIIDDMGPKTAELPDPTVYPSEKMEELLDVGDLPDHLKDKAWTMLKGHVKAFGFDGRLGHYPSKVQVRTKIGQAPISLPMYGSSPAKREIINDQLDKWFAQGVIEPSQSPWGAPVVIAYRNGKPRFCIDYRKLNAVTTPDEFPLPRQSEILASLSGAQVLSSLDALSGFTQLEMDEEHKEKTAFRTHRGLFQFRRMPFGLRNGPSIFQRITQGILSPYLWIFCLVYIDDIVVYSKSYEDHIGHLDKVLTLIENSGLTLSPTKCHLFYGSVLLLGHKVSRLGLSTHLEKVRAVLDLAKPTKLAELQTFLGMAVYFSAFIPYYADICSPFFALLRKGARWRWDTELESAWKNLKLALQEAPVLGHPMEGRPYRLYTDTSDWALGCALQQVQPMLLRDLKGTRVYETARRAFQKGEPPPKFTTCLSTKTRDDKIDQAWASNFDDTIVAVERVIGYWSRTFKSAETRYSTTEREALAAKEGLIRFQPFIEGETVLLITDHSALQWARTYENANRRLAAWGAVFSVYAPGLEIIHRAGRTHSNVDPLSRIPRDPPHHDSPIRDDSNAIVISATVDGDQDRPTPARKFSLHVKSFADVVDAEAAALQLETRRQKKRRAGSNQNTEADLRTEETGQKTGTKKTIPTQADKQSGGNTHVRLDETLLSDWLSGYATSPSLRDIWEDERAKVDTLSTGYRYFRDENGLLFFKDADFQPRLCVPETFRHHLLELAHESAGESAHCGAEKLWQRLSPKFYWKRMKADLVHFCKTCDTCQKIKQSNFNKYGYLIPNPIPATPYASISMDFIVNLPMSGEYNAILVVVDRLTKHANFIPTTTGLTAEDFGRLFVHRIVSRFGIPESIICDRDPRWTSDFWKSVAKELKSTMLFSSAHHPQTDGQTEILNKYLETMLRAYVRGDKTDWVEWLHLLEQAYNSTVHSSTGFAPFDLLLGFILRTVSDFLPVPRNNGSELKRGTAEFLDTLRMHRDLARQAIANAQHSQAEQYNKRRKPFPMLENGDRVLVNPHSLDWLESKGEGAKLEPKWIGPFEILERVNANVYRLSLPDNYPGSPVFNISHLKKYEGSD